jgi:hypothetical protein
MVVRPDGAEYQMCPICNGSGVALDPGLTFTYGIDFNAIAANGTAASSILVSDHTFRWIFLTGKSTGTFTFTVADGKNKRPFQTIVTSAGGVGTGVQNVNMVGTGQNPFPIPVPYEFAPKDNILISVTDTSGAPNTINLNLIGVEVE